MYLFFSYFSKKYKIIYPFFQKKDVIFAEQTTQAPLGT